MQLSDRQRQRFEALQAQLADRYGRILVTPDGKALLAFLEERFFNGELLGDTPEETAFNLGAREVVRRMRTAHDLLTTKPKQEG
jgi:hypothetical protein